MSSFSGASDPGVRLSGEKLEKSIEASIRKYDSFLPDEVSSILNKITSSSPWESSPEFEDRDVIEMAKHLGLDHFTRQHATTELARYWREKLTPDGENPTDVMVRATHALEDGSLDLSDVLRIAGETYKSSIFSQEPDSSGETKLLRFNYFRSESDTVSIEDISNAGKRGQVTEKITIFDHSEEFDIPSGKAFFKGVLAMIPDSDFQAIKSTAMQIERSLKENGLDQLMSIRVQSNPQKATTTDPYGTVPIIIDNGDLKVSIMPGKFSFSRSGGGSYKAQDKRTRGTVKLWKWAQKNKNKLSDMSFDEFTLLLGENKIKATTRAYDPYS